MLLPPVKSSRPLTFADLKQRVETHNTVQWLLGLLLIPGSLFLWILSFIILYLLFAVPLPLFGLPTWLAAFPAFLGIVLLVVEGIRGGWRLFESRELTTLEALRDSPFSESFGAGIVAYRLQGAIAIAGIVSDLLFCAPRASVMSLQAFNSRMPVDDRAIEQAVEIRRVLFERRQWQPLAQFESYGPAMLLLHRLDLITIDDRENLVKLPA